VQQRQPEVVVSTAAMQAVARGSGGAATAPDGRLVLAVLAAPKNQCSGLGLLQDSSLPAIEVAQGVVVVGLAARGGIAVRAPPQPWEADWMWARPEGGTGHVLKGGGRLIGASSGVPDLHGSRIFIQITSSELQG
jgi:hypothetical protein